ncbi:MAG TPA: ABC transporter ATP-binding protein [Polyangiaceae bacterium]|nr:ABC transporter ATP-binding protein [Polyangiaceae bacterium]
MNGQAPRVQEAAQRALAPGGPRAGVRIERAKNARVTLRRLATYFLPFRAELWLVCGSVVAYTLLGLLGPYLMGVAIDRYVATRDSQGLGRTALLMLGAYLSSNLLQLFGNWIMASVSQRALASLRRRLFQHLQVLPIAYFDQQPAGDLMSRLTSDIDAVNQAVSQNITALLASVLSMTGIIVAMFVLDHWLALAAVLVVPLMLWFTRFVALYTRRGFRELQRDMGALNAAMEESISGQKVIKAFRRTDSTIERFDEHNEAVYRTSVYANSYALLLMPLTAVLGNLFVIVLAGLGGYLALAGLVSVGVIATFINYSQNFINPLRQLSNLYNTIQAALAGAERVFEVLDLEPEVDFEESSDAPLQLRGEVKFENVEFGYRPDQTILHDMSLTAKPGELIALVGPTGAGKTTIVNLLTRFYEIRSGKITVDGIDLRTLPKPALRRELGIVLQDTFLFADSVLANIRYGRLDASDEEVMEAARLAQADAFIQRLPDGYQTLLSERGSNLSQGQRQLLAIARTLLADPAILILDEATSSVDTRTEVRIQSALQHLMKGRTSFVIAHRLSTIREATQILVIKDGTIAERGTHSELLAAHGFYARLYESQFQGIAT